MNYFFHLWTQVLEFSKEATILATNMCQEWRSKRSMGANQQNNVHIIVVQWLMKSITKDCQ